MQTVRGDVSWHAHHIEQVGSELELGLREVPGNALSIFFFLSSGLTSVVNTFVFVGSVVFVSMRRVTYVSDQVIYNFPTSTWVNIVTPIPYLMDIWVTIVPGRKHVANK